MSPRREPWVCNQTGKSAPAGAKDSHEAVTEPQISFAPAGAESCEPLPTAHAVGYSLPPLPGLGHALQKFGFYICPPSQGGQNAAAGRVGQPERLTSMRWQNRQRILLLVL